MATLLTPSVIDAQHVKLYDFIQEAFDIARKARLLTTDPTNADAFTLDQASPSAEEANIDAVQDVFDRVKKLQVKVDDAISEMEFSIQFLVDRARRKPPLPTAIGGPPFGVITSEAP